jgi:hypothetical protein
LEHLEGIDKEYVNLLNLHQPNLVKKTGCLIPCKYTDYKLATEPIKYDYATQTLTVKFSSPDVLERTEQLLYPMDSFISEFCGALGLFSGILLHDDLGLPGSFVSYLFEIFVL